MGGYGCPGDSGHIVEDLVVSVGQVDDAESYTHYWGNSAPIGVWCLDCDRAFLMRDDWDRLVVNHVRRQVVSE